MHAAKMIAANAKIFRTLPLRKVFMNDIPSEPMVDNVMGFCVDKFYPPLVIHAARCGPVAWWGPEGSVGEK